MITLCDNDGTVNLPGAYPRPLRIRIERRLTSRTTQAAPLPGQCPIGRTRLGETDTHDRRGSGDERDFAAVLAARRLATQRPCPAAGTCPWTWPPRRDAPPSSMPAGRELPAVIKNRNYPQPVKHPEPTALGLRYTVNLAPKHDVFAYYPSTAPNPCFPITEDSASTETFGYYNCPNSPLQTNPPRKC